MKVKKVSALRNKRGLHRRSGAEPQVVGLTPQTTEERKTDTMKTYILRQPKPVEPQKSVRSPRPKTGEVTADPEAVRAGFHGDRGGGIAGEQLRERRAVIGEGTLVNPKTELDPPPHRLAGSHGPGEHTRDACGGRRPAGHIRPTIIAPRIAEASRSTQRPPGAWMVRRGFGGTPKPTRGTRVLPQAGATSVFG